MAGFGTLSPGEEAEIPPNVLDNFVAHTFGALASLPRRAIQNSQVAVGTGTYNPAVPIEAALTMMGAAPAVSGVSRAGEVAMGIVPVDVAKGLGFKKPLPAEDTFRRAVENTPGAAIEGDVVRVPVTRNQRPEQGMQDSVRGGVFYLPQGSKDAKFYSGTGHNYAYGGTEKIQGETAFQSPMFVKGATGGKAPQAAFDTLNGKGAYETMRTDALRSTGAYYLPKEDKAELVRQFLAQHAPEMEHLSEHILANSTKGNQLAYALQEAAVASAVRKAGHDGVLGYSVKRNPTRDPFLSEVYDVRENKYPTKFGDYSIWHDLIDKPKGP